MTATTTGGDVDYERTGRGYAARRRTEPRIAARLHAALGSARTVLNVGAGAGSYEPEVRRSQSAWGFVDGDAERRFVEALERDVASGEWDRRHGAWRTRPELEGSLRLVVARPRP